MGYQTASKNERLVRFLAGENLARWRGMMRRQTTSPGPGSPATRPSAARARPSAARARASEPRRGRWLKTQRDHMPSGICVGHQFLS